MELSWEFRVDSRTNSSSCMLAWNQSWIKSLPKQTQYYQILLQCKNLRTSHQRNVPKPLFQHRSSVNLHSSLCLNQPLGASPYPRLIPLLSKYSLSMLILFVFTFTFSCFILLNRHSQRTPTNKIAPLNYCGHPCFLSPETSLHTCSMLSTDTSWHLWVPIQSLWKMSRILQVIFLRSCERYHVSPKKP